MPVLVLILLRDPGYVISCLWISASTFLEWDHYPFALDLLKHEQRRQDTEKLLLAARCRSVASWRSQVLPVPSMQQRDCDNSSDHPRLLAWKQIHIDVVCVCAAWLGAGGGEGRLRGEV